jgi:hypothetical protein
MVDTQDDEPRRVTPLEILRLTQSATDFLLAHPSLAHRGVARELGLLVMRKTVLIGQPAGEVTHRDFQLHALRTGRNCEVMQRQVRTLRASGFLRTNCRRFYQIDMEYVLTWARAAARRVNDVRESL